MKLFKELTFAKAYEKILNECLHHPKYVIEPRGEKVNEITNAIVEIDNPLSCFFKNEERSSQYKYIMAELVWYLSRDPGVNFISRYSKFWLKLLNPDAETVNSNYGNLIFGDRGQFAWAYESLVKDKDSRQAFMHFNRTWHMFPENKDQVCTMYGIFQIRDNRLNFTIHMRSNDVILGMPTDIPFFVFVQINMLSLLKDKYPELQLGTYTHIVNSMHLYERNHEKVKKMLKNDFIPDDRPFTLDGANRCIFNNGEKLEFFENAYDCIETAVPENAFERYVKLLIQ